MSSEYLKLLKIVNKLNKKEGEQCMICYFPDKKENLLKLDCGHYFHSKCLFTKKITYTCVYCPYCSKKIKIIKDKKDINSNIKCTAIIKNGINKGKICGRKNCKYHKNIIIEDNVCHQILKSGIRKGQECKRKNCKYHKKINNQIDLII